MTATDTRAPETTAGPGSVGHGTGRDVDVDLLVVGAGGGMEVATFLPANPGWRLTGVDPSAKMLALAQAEADRLGAAGRVTLVQGTVEDLPATACYDAATCIFVLQFLPDDAGALGKLALLRGVAQRLRPGAPLLLVTGVSDHREEF